MTNLDKVDKKDYDQNKKFLENCSSFYRGFFWGVLMSSFLYKVHNRFILTPIICGVSGYFSNNFKFAPQYDRIYLNFIQISDKDNFFDSPSNTIKNL